MATQCAILILTVLIYIPDITRGLTHAAAAAGAERGREAGYF